MTSQSSIRQATGEDKPSRIIAHAIHSGGFYGAEKVVYDLILEQIRTTGYKVVLLAFLDRNQKTNQIAEMVGKKGCTVIRFPSAPGMALLSLLRYVFILKTRKIDLVHTHGYKPTFFHVVTKYLRLHSIPILVTAHGYSRGRGGWKAAFYNRMDMFLFNHVDVVTTVSAETAKYIALHNRKCRPLVVENGIDPKPALKGTHPLKALFPDAGIPIIGSIGRLIPLKNHRLLIEAWAALDAEFPCHLAIIGEGPLRESLEALVGSKTTAGRGLILPFKSDILEWLNDLDVFVLPSLFEGLPMTVLEAGALKKPVVCSGVGGLPEIIESGRNGELFESGNCADLRDKLSGLVRDPARRIALGSALHETVSGKYDLRKTAARYLDLYARALGAEPG